MSETQTGGVPAENDDLTGIGRLFARRSGWLITALSNQCIDNESRPIPWFTFAATAFLAARVRPHFRVFEWGSGNSTLWWAGRCAHVTAIETSTRFFKQMRLKRPDNVKLRLFNKRTLPEDFRERYITAALIGGRMYHIVAVDGVERVECLKNSTEAVTGDGVIILDNADREEYAEGRAFLASLHWRELPFIGAGPIHSQLWQTSVFYRPNNCLGI